MRLFNKNCFRVTLEQNLSRYQDNNDTKSGTYQAITSENTGNLYLIIFVAASSILLTLIKYLSFFTFTKTASVNLHKTMVQAVLNSTMSFFDSNFLGNILNRFSKDCLTVDENLPYILIECLSVCKISYVDQIMTVFIPVVIYGCWRYHFDDNGQYCLFDRICMSSDFCLHAEEVLPTDWA